MQEKKNNQLHRFAEKALTESVVRMLCQQTDKDTNENSTTTKGSGFFITSTLIATNIHCIVGSTSVTAELVKTGTQYTIEGVSAYDPDFDVVVLKIAGEGIPLEIGNSDSVQSGDIATVVGYPHGETGEEKQVTIHDIQNVDNRIKIKEQIAPGYSGSPILNNSGQVIAIAVAAFMEVRMYSGGTKPTHSLAIPVNTITSMLQEDKKVLPLVEWQQFPRIQYYALFTQAQSYMFKQKFKEAIACYDTALEYNPDNVEIYINRASAKLLLNQTEEAIADCDAALKLNPELIEAYTNRSSANMLLGRFEDVISDCNSILKINPENLPSLIQRGTANIFLTETEAGMEDFDTAIKYSPDSPEIYYARAKLRHILNDYTGEIEDYDKIISISPEFTSSLNIYDSRADAKYQIKDYKGTIEDYSEIIENDPDNEITYINRGRVKRIIGDYAGAIEDCDKAIQLKPNKHHGAYYNRGYSKRLLAPSKKEPVEKLQLFQEAIEDYTEAIKLKHNHTSTHNNRGVAKFLYGETMAEKGDTTTTLKYYQESIIDYTEAVKIDSKNKTAYSNRGRANRRLGIIHSNNNIIDAARKNYSDSIDDYTETIKLDTKNSIMYYRRGRSKSLLGLLEASEGNTETAQNLFQTAISDSDKAIQLKKRKPNADYFFTRAIAKSGLENYAEALEDFNQAINIKSTKAIYYRDRAKTYEALGRNEEADADIIKAKELDPDVENRTY